MGVNPDVIVALLGGEGIASVIAAVSAFRAHTNSKQLQRNHGSSVADAVARIEAKVNAHDVEFRDMKKHIDLIGSQLIGVSDDVLARSRPAQMMSGGDIIDGVIMDKAEGVDFQGLKGNHPVCRIREDKIDDVYNTESGLKSIADLQILDYVCLNIDRHPGNMTYRFKDLDTDDPKFLGVTGIDNDASFGAVIPDPAQSTNKLPPLNKIKVISEEMAEKLQDKNAAENIRKKMVEEKGWFILPSQLSLTNNCLQSMLVFGGTMPNVCVSSRDLKQVM